MRRKSSSAPHRSGRTNKATAAGALLATATLLAVGVQTVPAAAKPAAPAPSPLRAGAVPTKLTPAQRTALIKSAAQRATQTAGTLGLGAQEKLVVKDVSKDADGTLHTRYERTYAGLPVLGGDLVVHTPPAAKATGTVSSTFNTRRAISVASTTPTYAKSAAETKALGAAKALDAEKATTDSARKVIWAGNGTPKLAWETVIGGLQDDGTPSQLHVITDALTGAKLYQFQAIKTGTGNSQYSGTVTIGTTLSGSTYQLNDTTRGANKTYSLNNGTSGTGTLMTDADDTWGTGAGSNTQTAGVDAHFGAQTTWDFYKNTFGRSGIKNDGVAAYSRVHYSTAYVNAFWDDSCFCMTYGDGTSSTHALTSLDVAGHEMTHGVTSNTAGLNYSGESGGLNEATSDIFGTGVEFYANNSTDVGDYLIGEKIDINGDGTPLRYMDKPEQGRRLGGQLVLGRRQPGRALLLGPGEPHVLPAVGRQRLQDHQRRHVQQLDLRRCRRRGHRPGRRPADLVQGADDVHDVQHHVRPGAHRRAERRRRALRQPAPPSTRGWATPSPVSTSASHITVPTTGVTVTNPGSQSSTVGTAVSLAITASSTNSGSLTYAATGLPTGLSISSSTGTISGTPTTAGTYSSVVTVTDSTGATGTASFTWTVNATGGGSCTSAQLLGNQGFESGNTTWTASSGVITTSTSQAARTGSYKAWLDGYGVDPHRHAVPVGDDPERLHGHEAHVLRPHRHGRDHHQLAVRQADGHRRFDHPGHLLQPERGRRIRPEDDQPVGLRGHDGRPEVHGRRGLVPPDELRDRRHGGHDQLIAITL